MTFPDKVVKADAFAKKNCMANNDPGKSSSSFDDGKAYLIGHYMKEFDPSIVFPDQPTDDNEDLELEMDKSYFMRVIMKASGEEYSKDFEVTMSMTNVEAVSIEEEQ